MYVYRLQVYTGKNLENSDRSVGLCSQVVLDLMAGLEKQGHDLYTDNYYTSPQLFQSLTRGSMLVGQHEPTGDTSHKILCTKGNSTNVVSMITGLTVPYWQWYGWTSVTYTLSTLHRAETSGDPTTVKRRQLDGC